MNEIKSTIFYLFIIIILNSLFPKGVLPDFFKFRLMSPLQSNSKKSMGNFCVRIKYYRNRCLNKMIYFDDKR